MSGGQILSLALLGGIALSTSAGALDARAQSQAAPHYTWVTLSGQWFCRSWSDQASQGIPSVDNWSVDLITGRAAADQGNTTAHCTTLWHVDSRGRLVSDDPSWAPNADGGWPFSMDVTPLVHTAPTLTLVRTPQKAFSRVSHAKSSGTTTSPVGPSSGGGSYTSGKYGAWTPVPGHPSYRMSDFSGDPNHTFGVCTWYAWYAHRSESALMKLGRAASWISNARKYGLSVGSTPRAGATAVFSAGVQGAGGTGHVGHVEVVLTGGWFIISEMNFSWNGGGWGHVDWRYVHVGSGVAFIY